MLIHDWLAHWSAVAWPAVANHLWQATVVSSLALAAALLLRRGPGQTRYILLLIASATFALPSALLGSIATRLDFGAPPFSSSAAEPADAFTVISALATPIPQPARPAAATAARHGEIFCLLTVAWIAVASVLLARWWIERRRLKLAIGAETAGRSTREDRALGQAKIRLGIKRNIGVSISRARVEPGVWGVFRPVVLLPATVADELSDAELETVMMHEMIHVARWDNLAANLNRLLCCLFWFHPLMWIIDRLLLSERERACDEKVLRLGGAPDVYAASLVKVLRFCLGWSVTGASNATGSNLGRRLERIMSNNLPVEVSMRHRALIGAIAITVVALLSAAGLVNRGRVAAQSRTPQGGVVGGVPGGVPGGVAGGVPGGIVGGIIGGVVGGVSDPVEQGKLIERLEQAPEVTLEFRNSSTAPVVITDARAKAVLRSTDEPGDDYVVMPIITVVSNSDRRIKGIAFEFRNGLERRAYYEFVSSGIDARGAYTSGRQSRIIFLPGGPSAWSVRVAGVLFEDGDTWGTLPPPPPPPPPPLAITPELRADLDRAAEVAVQFKNPPGSPLSITSAVVRSVPIQGDSRQPNSDNRDLSLIKPTVQVVNNTARQITSFVLEFSNPNAKLFVQTRIEPNGSATIGAAGAGPSGGPLFTSRGGQDQMEVTILGAMFEDGEIWGEGFPPPPPPPPPAKLETMPGGSKLVRKATGVMQASAIHRVDADYPPLARAARISGSVVVEVTVDESGSVIAARAISGHPLLKDAAVDAARQWKFSPTTISGEPVKVVGSITFQFEP